MKNRTFSGWVDVFLFTFKQGINRKYATITIVLALILFVAGAGINIVLASRQQSSDNISAVEKVYIIDESGIDNDWTDDKHLDREQFPNVTFEPGSGSVETLSAQIKENADTKSLIAKVVDKKDSYQVNVYIPSGSEIGSGDADNIVDVIKENVHDGIIRQSGVDSSILTYVISDMDIEFSAAGEMAKSNYGRMIDTVVPMIFMFILYFMVIIYGQSMGQITSIEKSSKLMETLLVMTKPYGLIFGKIAATASIAIIQIGVWFAAGIGGFIFGDGFARNSIYSGYENIILSILKEAATDGNMNAFSAKAIILATIAVCMAFFFFCILAGAIASFASKAEELGSVMMFYNMFMVIGFLGAYLLPLMIGATWIKVLFRVIPVSAAFLLPGEIIVGNISATEAIIYLFIMFAWIILTAIFAGRVYKNQVFYRGKGLKDILPWMKKKNDEDNEQWQYLHDEAGRPMEKSQRVGYFFVAISPFAIFLIIQIFGSLVLTNIMTRMDLKGIDLSLWEVKDYVEYYHGIENTLNPLTVMVCHLLIITTAGLWTYYIRRGVDRNNIIHVRCLAAKIKTILCVCIVCGIGLCLLANGVVAMMVEILPDVVERYQEMAQSSGFGISPFAIFAAVCLAPVGEELLCRGVCFHFAKKSLGKFWYANILQAALFGLLHMNWVQGSYAFIIGLVLGILVERYNSLLPAMIVHFIVNFSSTVWIPKVLGNVEMSLPMGIGMVMIPGIIVTAVLVMSREKGK